MVVGAETVAPEVYSFARSSKFILRHVPVGACRDGKQVMRLEVKSPKKRSGLTILPCE